MRQENAAIGSLPAQWTSTYPGGQPALAERTHSATSIPGRKTTRKGSHDRGPRSALPLLHGARQAPMTDDAAKQSVKTATAVLETRARVC